MSQIKPLNQVKREHIVKVLTATGGDQAKACAVLGITPAQLRRLLSLHHLTPPSPQPDPEASPPSSQQKE